MSAPDIDHKITDQFVALADGAHLTIVLGAGASAPSGLPTWNRFAGRLALLSGLVTTESAAEVLLNRQDPTIVLAAARARSADQWSAHLVEALYRSAPAQDLHSPLHLAAVAHYLDAPDRTVLSTLNFDTLLESALAQDVQKVAVNVDGIEPTAGTTPVYHLHGAIYEQEAYSPVVDYLDFAELMAQNEAWQFEFLKKALERGPLLLAGTSYRDPDIRHWLHLILRDNGPSYPAWVTIAREGLELDRETFDVIDHAIATEWESIGLTALRMQDLSDVASVVREMKFAGIENYQTPNQRVRRVWDAHKRDFKRRQTQCMKLLRDSSQRIARELGTTSHRATLWLANARGHLARWATEGSEILGIGHMKRVPTGHDSPWIAGEAIGAEEVKLKDVERDHRVRPTWRSVLAIPIFVSDETFPPVAAGVLTFGLNRRASSIPDDHKWWHITEELSNEWGKRMSDISFSH